MSSTSQPPRETRMAAYSFGQSSSERLYTCHHDLQRLLQEAIKIIDFSVLCGYRDEAAQTAAVNAGSSKVQFPNSKHNILPSVAVDIAPYPLDWDRVDRFAYLQGIIRGLAHSMGISIRLGGDWDMDGDITDHRFVDWPHIELVTE